jgi:multicomponent Na+:H+ antiporter subunit G
MSMSIDIASWICLLAGGCFCIVSTIGLNRMPDFFTRVHAAGITDTVGAGLVLLGLMLQAGWTLVMVKLAFIGLLIFFNSPAATHALTKAALAHGMKPLLHQEEPPSNLS